MLAAEAGQETDHRVGRPGPPTGFAVPVLETGSPGPGTGFAVPALETGKAGAGLLHLDPGMR